MSRRPRLFVAWCSLAIVMTPFSRAQNADETNERIDATEASRLGVTKHSAALGDGDSGEQPPKFLLPGSDPENRLVTPFLKHIVADQKQFFASTRELKKPDALKTFLPFAGFTGLLIASDSWMARQVPDKPNQLKRSQDISNYAVFSLIGLAGGAYGWGQFTHNDRLSETGFLSGEAALNSTIVAYGFKEIAGRERPYQGQGNGAFFQGGSSFPSEHSAIAWSVASVVAHEYPGILTKIAAYGLASTVSLTRVTGKQHFPSDVVVGSALGWYFGRQVYRAHHDPELGGAPWGNLMESAEKGPRNPENMGSPYVSPDSWVYPLLERLAALGYVQSAYLGMRPWTRMECARLLEEAGERIRYDGIESGQAQKIYEALAGEFADETARLDGASNVGVSLDSVYSRSTEISGLPLRDGYHFAQTIVNDFGRPYGEGFNNASGVSAHAVAGPFAFYVRGEYQHAPSSPSDPQTVLHAIANADLTRPVSNAQAETNRFQLLEGSVALNVHNTQFSFGKQSLWLGPGESGPLLFSNNAESIVMFKIDSVSPYRIPLLSNALGPVRTEFFLGRLSGQTFEFDDPNLLGPGNINPQPFLHGSNISFKPTDNLEFGMGITAQFAGPGLPFTWHNFLRTFYAHTATGPTAGSNNPGKRLSAFNFSYRVPGLRKWLTIYNDSLVVDEISPLGSSRPSLSPGIYLPQLPRLAKLELRAEFLRTNQTHEFAPGFVYYGVRRYRSGYTNDGNLLGSWIGRAGQGGQAWLIYSLSPRSKFQLGYRHQEVNKDFIRGGHLNDFSAKGNLMLSPDLALSVLLQYEQWRFPILSPIGQSNVMASIQLVFYPKWRVRK
jgi:hypothetical protein